MTDRLLFLLALDTLITTDWLKEMDVCTVMFHVKQPNDFIDVHHIEFEDQLTLCYCNQIERKKISWSETMSAAALWFYTLFKSDENILKSRLILCVRRSADKCGLTFYTLD